MSGQTPKKGVFTLKYVSFSSANVSVNLDKFLATKAGKKLVKGSAKNASSVVIKAARQPKRDKVEDVEQEVAA